MQPCMGHSPGDADGPLVAAARPRDRSAEHNATSVSGGVGIATGRPTQGAGGAATPHTTPHRARAFCQRGWWQDSRHAGATNAARSARYTKAAGREEEMHGLWSVQGEASVQATETPVRDVDGGGSGGSKGQQGQVHGHLPVHFLEGLVAHERCSNNRPQTLNPKP